MKEVLVSTGFSGIMTGRKGRHFPLGTPPAAHSTVSKYVFSPVVLTYSSWGLIWMTLWSIRHRVVPSPAAEMQTQVFVKPKPVHPINHCTWKLPLLFLNSTKKEFLSPYKMGHGPGKSSKAVLSGHLTPGIWLQEYLGLYYWCVWWHGGLGKWGICFQKYILARLSYVWVTVAKMRKLSLCSSWFLWQGQLALA